MKHGRAFGTLLTRLREEAGYRTPRAFFEAQGGRGGLGCALKAYVDAERGRAVPQPALAGRLAAGLRVGLDEEVGAEYARTYLRALFGGDDFLEFAAWALRRDAPPRRRGKALPAPAGSGEPVLDHPFLLRASEAELLDYTPYLERALSDACASQAKDGDEHVVEVKVTRLLPF